MAEKKSTSKKLGQQSRVGKAVTTPVDDVIKPKAKTKKRLVVSLVTLLVIALIGGMAWFGWQYKKTQDQLKTYQDPQKAVQAAGQALVSDVGKIMILPQKETPTVATVTDVNKLRDRTFFKDAQNGDKVLIYSQAQKAILYRPSTRQIVEVAAYDPSNQSQQSPQPQN